MTSFAAPTQPLPPRLAVLGIGMMGFPMARRLCEAGWRVTVWNRTPYKAERLQAFGAQVAHTPAQAVADADVVITLLLDGSTVQDVLLQQGVADAMRPGAVLIDMSSIKPAEARQHAEILSARGVQHLDAPVSGGTVGAEAGTLAIMVGGDVAEFDKALPVLQVLGRATHVGPHGSGQLAKLANQMIVGITIGAVAEALLLCEKGGADMAKVRQAIAGGFADSRVLQVHGQRMVERDFAKRGSMNVQLKDMRNALDTAASLNFEAPITALFERLYSQGVAHGSGELDQSALFLELAQRNGMDRQA